MLNYLKKFIPFSLVIACILTGLSFIEQFKEVMTFAWICFILFFLLAIVTFYFSSRTINGQFSRFMYIFFAGIIAKLILTAIVVLVFKSTHDTSSVNFIIPFAIVYFSFLFFDTAQLVKLSRGSK